MKRILLIGKNGQIGWELQRTLAPLGTVTSLDREQIDLANPDSIRKVLRDIEPALIVNAAAYTAVDQAQAEPGLAMAVNGIAPGVLAEEAKRLKAGLIHYSTDYIFDGKKAGAYEERDAPAPLNEYGKSKLAGDRAIQQAGCDHIIFRTSWVYGARGNNFLLTVLRLARERDQLRIVDDQFGAPTWCRMIAEATALVLSRRAGGQDYPSGIYNLTCGGRTSWFGFTQAIIAQAGPLLAGRCPVVAPIASDDYQSPAKRPANSVLSNDLLSRVFGVRLPAWEQALALCLQDVARLSA